MDASPLLLEFVNTVDVEIATDAFGTPGELTAWLLERDLIDSAARADTVLLTQTVQLRTALRAAMAAHHGDRPDPDAGLLCRALSPFPLRVCCADGPGLSPANDGAAGGVARVAVAGTWARLKICSEETCQWAFHDASKNRSRTWCSMRVCGNRTKTRAYRARQRAE
ncbi:MAG: CGNR zinc finger domain-containing protein [Streptosporangiaceae bacterium]